MAAPRSLLSYDPRSHGPSYVVLAKASNQNQVSAACSSERMYGFDGEDHVSGVEGKDRKLLVEAVSERTRLGFWNPWERYQNCLLKQPLCTQIVTSTVLWSLGDLIAQILSMAMSDLASVATVNPNSTAGSPASFSVKDVLPKNDDNLDWRRVAASGSFGGAFVGPTGHYWFAFAGDLLLVLTFSINLQILMENNTSDAQRGHFSHWESFRYQFLEYVCTNRLKLEPNSGRFVGAKLCADTLLFGPLHLLVFFFYTSLAAGKTLLQFKQDLSRDYFPTLLTEGVMWTCVQVLAQEQEKMDPEGMTPGHFVTKADISSLNLPILETDDHLEPAQGKQFELHEFLKKLRSDSKVIVAGIPYHFETNRTIASLSNNKPLSVA